jgi:folylpolyglutamate synthase
VARFTALPPVGASDALRSISLGLPGAHQASNAQLALALTRGFLASSAAQAAFRLSQPSDLARQLGAPPLAWEKRALEEAQWPGRCQCVPTTTTTTAEEAAVTYFLDGAHTTDSLAHATSWFVDASPPLPPPASTAAPQTKTQRVLLFNCTHGRSARELLEALLHGIEDAEREKAFFDHIIFCTNETYRHGSSGGTCPPALLPD